VNNFKISTETNDKRQLFIDATICALAEHGYKGTTVRKIAKIAGVAPGLLTHYFSGKEVLIAESYQYLAKKFLDRFDARIAGMEDKPLQALKTFIDTTFEPDNLDPKLLKVWLSFWSLTLAEPELRHIHRESYHRYVAALEAMLQEAYKKRGTPQSNALIHAQAIGINALLDGLWLEWCLDPETFSPKEGIEIIYDFTERTTGFNLQSQ